MTFHWKYWAFLENFGIFWGLPRDVDKTAVNIGNAVSNKKPTLVTLFQKAPYYKGTKTFRYDASRLIRLLVLCKSFLSCHVTITRGHPPF